MSEPSVPMIEALWRAGCDAWPGVTLDRTAFTAHVTRHTADGAPRPQHTADLYLACACAAGDSAALHHFEDRVLPAIAPALRQFDRTGAFADEVRQLLRTRLLVAEGGGSPRIGDYAGRGPLVTWVRVAAVRLALDLRITGGREVPTTASEIVDLSPSVEDPALASLKQRFAGEFRTALERACSRLPDRDRTILRLRFVDGLNIDQIGGIYGAHRATVARWIAAIRDTLFDGTRDELRRTTGIDGDEFDSLVRLARSQLDVSLSTVLGPR